MFASECPTSAVDGGLWDTIDLFWMCHSVDSSGSVSRTGYPESGAVLEQSSWTMWAFAQIEAAFLLFLRDHREDQRHAHAVATAHEHMRRSR